MTLPIKSIFICLVILAMASDVHTQGIQEVGGAQQLAKGMSLVYGSGVQQGQLPIITYPLTTGTLDVSVYIQPKKQCNFKFSLNDGTNRVLEPGKPAVEAIRQIGNKIIIQWSLLLSLRGQWDTLATTISILDMGSCANKKIVEFQLPSDNIVSMVAFVDGFDIITSKNSRTRYDTNGILVKTESFPVNSDLFSISPVSVQSHTSGFFIADYAKKVLNLVTDNGTILKTLLKPMPAGVYTNNEQSSYSVCSFDSRSADIIYCSQYDESGTEKWKNKAKIAFPQEMMSVKNAKGGGIVLAAWKIAANQLCFVKMGPKLVKTWSYTAKHPFQTARLMDFDEAKSTFSLAYEIISDDDSMTLQNYSLV